MLQKRSWFEFALFCSLFLFALMALFACAPSTPPGATASATFSGQATAIVTTIDKANRLVTLRDVDGQVSTLRITDAVRNFDQIKVGDTVKVDYQERIDILVAGNVEPIRGVILNTTAIRAPKGQKPAGGWAISAKRSVQIVSVDRNSHTVTFREADGTLDSFVVQNPDNFALADGLQPGTIVDVTESAATAVSVQKI
jgi:hypothetical protein